MNTKRLFSEQNSISPDVLRLIVNMEKQLSEQKEQIQKIDGKTAQIEKNFRILITELIQSGYINVPERRKMLKRSLLDHEALMNLLKKKGIISTREFRKEIRQIVQREKKIKSP